jgi:hypothetical protein
MLEGDAFESLLSQLQLVLRRQVLALAEYVAAKNRGAGTLANRRDEVHRLDEVQRLDEQVL